jgi:hypothetical protein
MKSRCFVFKLKRKKQVLAFVLIEDLGFLPLVRAIQRLSKDGICHTSGRNPRSSIGTPVKPISLPHRDEDHHQISIQDSSATRQLQSADKIWPNYHLRTGHNRLNQHLNRVSKYLFLPFQLKNKASRFHSFIRMSMSCLLHKILQCHVQCSKYTLI